MIEKESLTHRIEDDMEIRNRNWDIIKTHLRNYTEQRQQDQLKVAKVEKELNDYKKVMSQVNINQEAKQSTSGYGIVDLPKNAANGQVSVSVKGNTETDEESNAKSTLGAMKVKSVGKNLWGIKHDSNKMLNQIAGNILDGTRQIPNYKNYIVGKIKVKKQIYTIIPDKKTTFIPDTKSPYVLFTKNGYVEKGILIEPNQIRAIELDGEYDIILGSYWSRQLDKNDYCNLKYLGIDEEYEPYKESTAYIVAKKDNKIVNLRSLPNGTKDEIRLSEGKAIIKIGTKTDVASGTVINYTDMAENGTYYAWNEDGETETGIKGDTLGIDATKLIYQLAEPEIIPIEVSGNIVSNPSGTIYIEQATFSTGIYNDNMKVMCNDLPIKSINKIIKIDYETGVEHELDTLKAVISEDKLSFAHPDLTNGDIVFFDYEYDLESTHGETTVEFYDSRYTIKDSVTGKFYQWNVTVADGVPSIDLKEV